MIIEKQIAENQRPLFGKPTAADLETINREFALEAIGEDDVTVVTLDLANDAYDRGHERFTAPVLERFRDTIIGKSLMVGHDKSKYPLGTFFDAEVIQRDGVNHLRTRAYLPAADPHTQKIRMGIGRYTSIGASAHYRECDLCKKPYDPRTTEKAADRCTHYAGRQYGDEICRVTWSGDPQRYEAREGSIVYLGQLYNTQVVRSADYVQKDAVPGGSVIIDYEAPDSASAGQEIQMELQEALETIKRLETEKSELETKMAGLQKQAEDGATLRGDLFKEIQRKYKALKLDSTGANVIKNLECSELSAVKEADAEVQKMFDERFPPSGNAEVNKGAGSEEERPKVAERPVYAGGIY